MMKLYHDRELIGLIRNPGPDNLSWMMGTIELSPTAKKYKEFFAFFADEDRLGNEKPPFPPELLKDWNIEVENGKRQPIAIPDVYENGEIFWRWLRLGNISN